MKDSLSIINDYLKQLGHHTAVKCNISNSKGRFLSAQKPLKAGDLLFSSEPLCIISEPNEPNPLYSQLQSWVTTETWECESIWYWCCMSMIVTESEVERLSELLECARLVNRKSSISRSNKLRDIAQNLLNLPLLHLSEEVRTQLMLFHAPLGDNEEISYSIKCLYRNLRSEIKFEDNGDGSGGTDDDFEFWLKEDLMLLDFLNDLFEIRKLEKYSRIWILNCFDCSEETKTAFGTYFTSTFINHSCLPNTVWHVSNDGQFHLMARSNIERGEEITLAYLSDMDLLSPSIIRIQELEATKHFTCICPRCTAIADPCRGMRCQKCYSGQWFMLSKTDFLSKDPVFAEQTLDTIMAKQIENDKVCFMPEKLPQPLCANYQSIQDLSFIPATQIKWLKGISPQKCLSCGHTPIEIEINIAISVESYIYNVHQRLESIEDNELARIVQNFSQFCGQHYYYTELLANQASRCLTNSPVNSRIMTETRCRMYSSRTMAWSRLDIFSAELACLNIKEDNFDNDFKQMDRPALESLYEVRELVFNKCIEALVVLKLLFSSKGEYFNEPYARVTGCWNALENSFKKDNHNPANSQISEALRKLA